MALLNGNLTKKLVIDDQLHISAIDLMFLELAPKNMVSIQGMTKKNNRWVLINGLHNINYGKDEHSQSCYIRANREKDSFQVEFNGEEPTKTMSRILGAKRIKINNESVIREFDIFIMNDKKLLANGGFAMDVVPSPMDDIYAITKQNERGYMILHKESKDDVQSYTIDVVGDYFVKVVDDILNGNADRVKVFHYSVVSDHIFVRIMDKIPLQQIFPCQQTIIDYVVGAYSNSKNKNVTILISGPAGSGKSNVAMGIAQTMKKKLTVDPHLIKGFNVNCDEMQYHPVINNCSPKYSTPVILLLDEFDIAMARANSPADDNNAHAISANKTNLNNFLDSINDEQFLVTVVTTNMPIAEINNKFGVYCRKGRTDKHFEITSRDVAANMFEPN